MKVKVISRVEEDYTRERKGDLHKVQRNYDPQLHQFEKAREYTRALNAAKLDRVFAKPFVAALPHDDGVTSLARNPKLVNSIISGAADGVILIWDIARQRVLRRLVGHTGAVRGISFAADGEACVSASTDATVKLWKVPYAPFEAGEVQEDAEAVFEFSGKHAFRGVDHHWGRTLFATAGAAVDIWDHSRAEPLQTFSWGSDTVTSVRFNPVRRTGRVAACPGRAPALHFLLLSRLAKRRHTRHACSCCALRPSRCLPR
jgi:WD repeat and SOF domain-containing protein 1